MFVEGVNYTCIYRLSLQPAGEYRTTLYIILPYVSKLVFRCPVICSTPSPQQPNCAEASWMKVMASIWKEPWGPENVDAFL